LEDRVAPPSWHLHGFPLREGYAEGISLDEVCSEAHRRLDRAEETGDGAHFGPVPHWAHLLKTEQAPDGSWPSWVNARTGEALGDQRTFAPALLLARLGAVLNSSEFDAAVARAVGPDAGAPE
jgi:hypothetical protein